MDIAIAARRESAGSSMQGGFGLSQGSGGRCKDLRPLRRHSQSLLKQLAVGVQAVMGEQNCSASLVSSGTIDLCWLSYSRAVANGLLGHFYETFLVHPQIRDRFAGTAAATQHEALRHGLSSMLKFVEGDRMGCECLKRIRKSHSRAGLGVDPALDPLWSDSLFRALRRCDPLYDPQTEKAWRTVTELGLECLRSGY